GRTARPGAGSERPHRVWAIRAFGRVAISVAHPCTGRAALRWHADRGPRRRRIRRPPRHAAWSVHGLRRPAAGLGRSLDTGDDGARPPRLRRPTLLPQSVPDVRVVFAAWERPQRTARRDDAFQPRAAD